MAERRPGLWWRPVWTVLAVLNVLLAILLMPYWPLLAQ
jgi:hypothetical protein